MFLIDEIIDPYLCNTSELITAKSHLIDRFVPECELVQLPERSIGGGRLTVRLQKRRSSPYRPMNRVAAAASRVLNRETAHSEIEGYVIDFRTHHPDNWAHALNNHLPLLFHILDSLGSDVSDNLSILLPADIPGYITDAFRFFGFSVIESNQEIGAEFVDYDMTPWIGMRAIRHEWVAKAAIDNPVLESLLDARLVYPEKIFISRRDTRRLINQKPIEAYLAKLGYKTIYPEEHSMEDQFGLITTAREIVAIHGAAIAPLLYRRHTPGSFQLIELLPVGHMTNVYRVMTQQVGGRWIGVRGRISADHARLAYDFSQPFTKFSLQDFEIDLESLELAFQRISQRDQLVNRR